jgi:hypothetical protein
MVVTCPVGMRIPASPVSKHNPVLSAKVGEVPRFARRTAEGGCPYMNHSVTVEGGYPYMVRLVSTSLSKEIE